MCTAVILLVVSATLLREPLYVVHESCAGGLEFDHDEKCFQYNFKLGSVIMHDVNVIQ